MTHYSDATVTLHHGDCLDVLRTLPDASVDSVVTDPPYGLEFMGKEWDSFKQTPNAWADRDPRDHARPELKGQTQSPFLSAQVNKIAAGLPFQQWCTEWAAECLRVLKPGGHLLAFGGTRTWHRLACAVEDAGFEVRDSLAWLHGQGFPKSMNVSNALGDKQCQCPMGESQHGNDDLRGVRQGVPDLAAHAAASEVSDLLPSVQRQGTGSGVGQVRVPGAEDARAISAAIRPGESRMEGGRHVPEGQGQLHRPALREVPPGVPEHGEGGRLHHGAPAHHGSVDRPLSAQVGSGEPHQPRPEGQQAGEPGAVPEQRGSQEGRGWPVCAGCGKPSVPDGLGTALKPAFEPVVVARKPLVGTVAGNVLTHGTGALNIDATRIEGVKGVPGSPRRAPQGVTYGELGNDPGTGSGWDVNAGRWPANVVLDETQAEALDEQSGERATGGGVKAPEGKSHGFMEGRTSLRSDGGKEYAADSGGASRFFYVAKADSSERPRVNGTAHPTVKPLALMRWLVRLVTPPGGVVLEPFAGSGTTVEACIIEGFRCIAIEKGAEYLPLIEARIARRRDPVRAIELNGEDMGLFDFGEESA